MASCKLRDMIGMCFGVVKAWSHSCMKVSMITRKSTTSLFHTNSQGRTDSVSTSLRCKRSMGRMSSTSSLILISCQMNSLTSILISISWSLRIWVTNGSSNHLTLLKAKAFILLMTSQKCPLMSRVLWVGILLIPCLLMGWSLIWGFMCWSQVLIHSGYMSFMKAWQDSQVNNTILKQLNRIDMLIWPITPSTRKTKVICLTWMQTRMTQDTNGV